MNDVLSLIEQVRQSGVTLRADPPDLVITPAGILPTELKDRLKSNKPDILRHLELEESMRRLETVRICLAVWDDGGMRVVVTDSERSRAIDDGGTIYSSQDMYGYFQLEPHERRMLHEFKKRLGGTVEWQNGRRNV